MCFTVKTDLGELVPTCMYQHLPYYVKWRILGYQTWKAIKRLHKMLAAEGNTYGLLAIQQYPIDIQ